MRHYVITGVLVIVLAIVTYAGLMAIKLMPVQASAQSVPIDQLWINPDCGLKTRKWEEVKPALKNMVEAVKNIRATI